MRDRVQIQGEKVRDSVVFVRTDVSASVEPVFSEFYPLVCLVLVVESFRYRFVSSNTNDCLGFA